MKLKILYLFELLAFIFVGRRVSTSGCSCKETQSSLCFKVRSHFTNLLNFASVRLFVCLFEFIPSETSDEWVCATSETRTEKLLENKAVELFWQSSWIMDQSVRVLIDGWFWLIGEIKGVCEYLTVFVFWSRLIDTRTNIIINKSRRSAAFDIRPAESQQHDWCSLSRPSLT